MMYRLRCWVNGELVRKGDFGSAQEALIEAGQLVADGEASPENIENLDTGKVVPILMTRVLDTSSREVACPEHRKQDGDV